MVKIDVSQDGIGWVTGTDLDIVVEAKFLHEFKQGFSVVVPAKRLLGLLRVVSKLEEKIGVIVRDGEAEFSAGNIKATFLTFKSEDWPEFSEHSITTQIRLPERVLADILHRVSVCISTEETRYYLNGVYFETCPGNRLSVTAADGHRLAKAEIAHSSNDVTEKSGHILPTKAVMLVKKLAKREETTIRFLGTAKMEIAIGDDIIVRSTLIDGTYPDYYRALPDDAKTTVAVRFDIDEMRDAIKIMTAFNEPGRPTKFTFDTAITMETKNPDYGSASTKVAATFDAIEAPFQIGLNSRYVLDALGIFRGAKTIRASFIDPDRPVRFDADIPGVSVFAVLMPMRV